MASADPTLTAVQSWFDEHAPTHLAGAWDNVGLIAQSPVPSEATGVFLAVDLTPAVAEELLARGDIRVAVVYHPVIFGGVKALTMQNALQRSILRCIAAGIHLYCPHTTLDACHGGINDWLIAGLSHAWETCAPGDLYSAVQHATYEVIEPNDRDPSVGMGRRLVWAQPVAWSTLVARTKALLRVPYVQVAPAPGVTEASAMQSLGVCAGSGSSILRRCAVDVFVTGEMGHHDLLAANARGVSVIVANHTNTERQYLKDVLRPAMRASHPTLPVYVSEHDADPLRVV